MLYIYAAAALFGVYYFRRYWLNPWGAYVRHTETKAGGVFMVVRHVRWYPPFLSFERTYHQCRGDYLWSDEATGYVPPSGHDSSGRQRDLRCMFLSAKAREAETEELLRKS